MRASSGRLRFAVPLLALTSIAPGALAAPPQPPSAPVGEVAAADAKRHFEAGVKLHAERVYAGALAEFEESYRLGGKAVALKNVAQCHRDLKQFAEAYDTYRQLLASHGAELKAKDKGEVEKSVEELAKVIGTIEIVAEPAGAEVSIDGRLVGTSPVAPVHVDVGAHEIKITKPGFQPFTKSVSLVAEQHAAVSAALAAEVTTGHLLVSEPAGLAVKVLVDEKEVGAAPWEGDLAPGTHTIQLVAEGLASEKRSVDVQVKGRLEISLSAQATAGKIDVRVVPASAELFLDAKPLGRGSYAGPVEPGQHTLEASAPGFHAQRTTLTIERGKAFPVVITLIEDKPSVDPGKKRRDDDGDDAPREDAYRGVYGRLSFSYLYPAAGKLGGDAIAPAIQPGEYHNDVGTVVGGAATLRVGYNFDPVAIEFIGSFARSEYDATLDYFVNPAGGFANGQPYTEKIDHTMMSGFAGLGGRVTSRDDSVRFSLGVGVGAAYRYFQLNDAWSSPSGAFATSSNDASTSVIVPALTFDADLIVGRTPGTKFVLGVEGWAELGSTQSVSYLPDRSISLSSGATQLLPKEANSPYTVAKGTAFYVGPHVGLQFGR